MPSIIRCRSILEILKGEKKCLRNNDIWHARHWAGRTQSPSNPATNLSVIVTILQMRKMRLKGIPQRKYLIRMFSFIKKERWRFEAQTPS